MASLPRIRKRFILNVVPSPPVYYEPVPDVKNANKLLALCGDTLSVRQGDVVRKLRISMLRVEGQDRLDLQCFAKSAARLIDASRT